MRRWSSASKSVEKRWLGICRDTPKLCVGQYTDSSIGRCTESAAFFCCRRRGLEVASFERRAAIRHANLFAELTGAVHAIESLQYFDSTVIRMRSQRGTAAPKCLYTLQSSRHVFASVCYSSFIGTVTLVDSGSVDDELTVLLDNIVRAKSSSSSGKLRRSKADRLSSCDRLELERSRPEPKRSLRGKICSSQPNSISSLRSPPKIAFCLSYGSFLFDALIRPDRDLLTWLSSRSSSLRTATLTSRIPEKCDLFPWFQRGGVRLLLGIGRPHNPWVHCWPTNSS